jgi:predicted MPP superfamily phosphohydrolase
MTIIGRIVFIFILFILVDIYFFQSFKALQIEWLASRKWWLNRIYISISLLFFFGSILAVVLNQYQIISRSSVMVFTNVAFIVLIAKFMGSIPLLFEDLSRLIRWSVGLFQTVPIETPKEGISRAKFISYTSLSLAGLAVSTFVYGMVKTAYDFTVRRSKVALPNLPDSFNGLKIVQISDIHSGSFLSGEPIQKAVKQIMDLKPDLIFFTGDLVNDRASEMEPYLQIFSGLKAPLGVFSVLGNHDYGDYVQWPDEQAKQQNLDTLIQHHKTMGWDILLNEHRIIERNGEKIKILGVENWGAALRFPKYGDVNKAKANSEITPVTLLLSHDPSHWEAEITTNHSDIDLTFSGHTHGFQFGVDIPGFKWSPSQYVYKQWAGMYASANQKINVNRGFGFIGYLGRVGIKPEISLVELVKG